MHGFTNLTTKDVCEKVKVCEETLRKRLEEFKDTEVAKMTKETFSKTDIS